MLLHWADKGLVSFASASEPRWLKELTPAVVHSPHTGEQMLTASLTDKGAPRGLSLALVPLPVRLITSQAEAVAETQQMVDALLQSSDPRDRVVGLDVEHRPTFAAGQKPRPATVQVLSHC